MRTIREEDEFKKKLEGIGVSPRLLDELIEGIILTVATSPEIFAEVPGTPLRRFRVIPFPGIPRMNIWFRFDDEYVDFVEIDVMEDTTGYDL